MDITILEQFRKIFNRKRIGLRVRLGIFAFFLALASLLWVLNKLSAQYTTDLRYPVGYANLPKGKVMVGTEPQVLTIRTTATGFTLIRYSLTSRFNPIPIDLGALHPVPLDSSTTKFYLLTSRVRAVISSELWGKVQVEGVQPDTLFFEFSPLAERRVRVVPRLSLSFQRQHMQSGPIRVTPDSIIISGPKALIDTIFEVHTDPLRLDWLRGDVDEPIALSPIPQVGFSHRRVALHVPVQRFTQATISIPIIVNSLPDSLSIMLLPGEVTVRCNVPISQYAQLNSKLFAAQVDFMGDALGLGQRMRVYLTRKPDFVSQISLYPQHIDYILQRR